MRTRTPIAGGFDWLVFGLFAGSAAVSLITVYFFFVAVSRAIASLPN